MRIDEKGYVLDIQPYREADGMVLFLGETVGLIRLVLPGFYKAKSKQTSIGLQFSKVMYHFEYRENALNRIRYGELNNAYVHKRKDYQWLVLMALVSEIIKKTWDGPVHNQYYAMLGPLLESEKTMEMVIQFIVEVIQLSGISPYVDGCVVCNDSKVNIFSVQKGGFVCIHHAPYDRKDPVEKLLILRGLFMAKNINNLYDKYDKEMILLELIQYLEFHGDVRFNSHKLL